MKSKISSSKSFLILADFNNTLWGSVRNNNRDYKIGTEMVLKNADLFIFNINFPTIFFSYFNVVNNTFSCIDLSITNNNFTHNCEWTVLKDLYDSDHFLINIQLINFLHNQ